MSDINIDDYTQSLTENEQIIALSTVNGWFETSKPTRCFFGDYSLHENGAVVSSAAGENFYKN
jgi:hypothetical protein